MKKYSLLLVLFILLSGFGYRENAAGELLLKVENIRISKGRIWVGIYDSPNSFLDKDKAMLVEAEVRSSGQIYIPVEKLPFGDYAVALFHDVNNNGTLDQNFLGIPTEPYAFSGKLRSRWRLPHYDEVHFRFDRPYQVLELPLIRW